MDAIRFTLILPVCHGGPFLQRALASALRINYPPDRFELLVSAALLVFSVFSSPARPLFALLAAIYALALLAAGVTAGATKQRVCALFWVPLLLLLLLLALHLARGTGYLFPWRAEKGNAGTQH